jgi:hypothetical protein
MLNSYAVPAGLPAMTIPDTETLLDYLNLLWFGVDDDDRFIEAFDANAIYLLPYLLARGRMTIQKKGIFNLYCHAAVEKALYGDDKLLKLFVAPKEMLWPKIPITVPPLYTAISGETIFARPHPTLTNVQHTLNILLAANPSKEIVRRAGERATTDRTINPIIIDHVNKYLRS